jgi:clorobiocin/coumermycin A biosynthesis protein CloN7/CouN7
MSNAEVTTHVLDVPGARLHYEARGRGPLLVMNGVPMGTPGFAAVAPLLADDHTVVAYDPRAMFRSTVEDPTAEVTPEVLADDLHRLLSAVGAGPADVFASSGGAVTALALVARHPGQVRTLLAHEPPLTDLLPDNERLRAAIAEVCAIYVHKGLEPALKEYTALTGITRFVPPPVAGRPDATTPFTPPAEARLILDRFFRHILRPIAAYRPDLAALRAAPTRIVVGVGAASAGQLAHRGAVALAERLGYNPVEFPGDHSGFQSEPEKFVEVMRRVLAG